MFSIIGYIISIIFISFVVTILVEYTKRLSFIGKLVKFFNDKVKKVSWYQIESILIALIIFVILNLLGATALTILAILLNAIIIGLLSNGIFTYELVKSLLLKLKITSQIAQIINKKTKKINK